MKFDLFDCILAARNIAYVSYVSLLLDVFLIFFSRRVINYAIIIVKMSYSCLAAAR